MALLMARIGRDDLTIAHAYLKASWQEEENPEYYRADLTAAVERFGKYLAVNQEKTSSWQTAQLVSGELERRLGLFEAAQARFTTLQPLSEFQVGVLKSCVAYELQLIAAKDAGPHNLSECQADSEPRPVPIEPEEDKQGQEVNRPATRDHGTVELAELGEQGQSNLRAQSRQEQAVQIVGPGRVDSQELNRKLRGRYLRMIRYCYTTVARHDQISGRLRIIFTITEVGITTNIGFDASIQNQALLSCIKRRTMSLRFPRPSGGTVTVTMTVVFAPVEEE